MSRPLTAQNMHHIKADSRTSQDFIEDNYNPLDRYSNTTRLEERKITGNASNRLFTAEKCTSHEQLSSIPNEILSARRSQGDLQVSNQDFDIQQLRVPLTINY